jgi:menaquinone-specific isochorismate synthase
VAGLPRESALKQIESLEKFDRGWYAGPIGWLSKDGAEFAVALRSALLHDKEALVYAGAGIVKGSEPLKEWQEIENKLMNFTNLFNGR